MPEFLEPSLSWPTWPASMLVLTVCVYWAFVIVGAIAVDALHFDFHAGHDLHVDIHADGTILDLGFTTLRSLNLGRVPLMLWLSIFALASWLVSRVLADQFAYPGPHDEFELWNDALAIVRDFAIAALITKLLTNPLRGSFDVVEPISSDELIGQTCVITTGEANERSGEASYATGQAPLRLSVRTIKGSMERDEVAEIIEFSADENIYFVRRANQQEV